jgi:8-oxo-dGTP pyrophosphatase MutT (NUDIX family)
MDEAVITVAGVVDACRSLPPPEWHRIISNHPEPRRAATLVPIADVDGQAAVIITLRAGALDHGGDWVFPGGRVDDTDGSHREAARREASEELGLELERIEVVGQLGTRGPIVSGFVIETYVGVVSGALVLAPDPREVADVVVVTLADLLLDGMHHRGPMRAHRHTDRPEFERLEFDPLFNDLRHYRVRDEEYLWGLQADILHELLHHVTGGQHHF